MNIVELLGERCPDYDQNCAACFVWEQHDKIEKLQLALGAMVSAYDHAWEVGDAVVRCRKIMADGQKPWDEIEELNVKAKESADEIERLRWALKRISICEGGDVTVIWKEMRDIAIEALQQKESE